MIILRVLEVSPCYHEYNRISKMKLLPWLFTPSRFDLLNLVGFSFFFATTFILRHDDRAQFSWFSTRCSQRDSLHFHSVSVCKLHQLQLESPAPYSNPSWGMGRQGSDLRKCSEELLPSLSLAYSSSCFSITKDELD